MNFPLKPKPRRNENFSLALRAAVLFLIAVFIMSKFFPNFVFSILDPVAKPMWKIREAVSGNFTKTFSFVFSKQSLIDENEKLKQALLEANLKNLDFEASLYEDNLLKDYATSTAFFPARIMARPYESPYDIFIVDTGSAKAQVGEKVFGPENLALGEVILVSGETAKVRLYSSPNIETTVEISGTEGVFNVVGRGGGNFALEVPKGLTINKGSKALLPSMRSRVMAIVGSIEETEANSFKTIYLSYPINLFSIDWVYIQKNEN